MFNQEYPEVLAEWDDIFGDRMNQIVFIGRDFDEEKIKEQLDGCTVSYTPLVV